MLDWNQLEELAGLAQQRVADAGDNAAMLEEMGLLDEERAPMRRRLANVFINLGARIDPDALPDALEEAAVVSAA
jgi:hypothetical protein